MYPSCDYTEKIKVNAENGFHLALLWFEFQIETSALSRISTHHRYTAQCAFLASLDEIQAGHFVCAGYTSTSTLKNTLGAALPLNSHTQWSHSLLLPMVPSRYPTDTDTTLLHYNQAAQIFKSDKPEVFSSSLVTTHNAFFTLFIVPHPTPIVHLRCRCPGNPGGHARLRFWLPTLA